MTRSFIHNFIKLQNFVVFMTYKTTALHWRCQDVNMYTWIISTFLKLLQTNVSGISLLPGLWSPVNFRELLKPNSYWCLFGKKIIWDRLHHREISSWSEKSYHSMISQIIWFLAEKSPRNRQCELGLICLQCCTSRVLSRSDQSSEDFILCYAVRFGKTD